MKTRFEVSGIFEIHVEAEDSQEAKDKAMWLLYSNGIYGKVMEITENEDNTCLKAVGQ